MVVNARKEIAAPTVSPLPYGLMSVVQEVPDSDPHWKLGVWYRPDSCAPSMSTQERCITADAGDAELFVKTPTQSGLPTRGTRAFTLYSYIDCGPVGTYEEYEELSRRAFVNGEGRALEDVFWTGDVDVPDGGINYPHLAADTEVLATGLESEVILQTAAEEITGSAAFSVVEAIGLLEGAMGECYGGVPTIHVPRKALAVLANNDLVIKQGETLRTLGGSLIAAGAGYPGTGPDGTLPADQLDTWFYATGSIVLQRGEIKVTSALEAALDRNVNSMVMIAERTYTLGWDCCHFAIQVDLSTPN